MLWSVVLSVLTQRFTYRISTISTRTFTQVLTCLLISSLAVLNGCDPKPPPEKQEPKESAENQAAKQLLAPLAPEEIIVNAPMGITATAGNKSIKISWSAVEGATQYNVYMATEPGIKPDNYWTLKNGATFATSTDSYTNSGLQNGTAYYFVVTTVGTQGESEPSSQITATPKPLVSGDNGEMPSTPTNLVATAGKSQVTLAWDVIENANQYNLYMATEFGVTPSTYNNLRDGMAILNVSNPYTHLGLKNNTVYYFVVTASNNSGESIASHEAFATPLAPDPIPEPPQNIRVHSENGKVVLNWDGVKYANRYNIYMATESGVTASNYAVLDGSLAHKDVTSPFTQRGLINDREYYFVVTSENESGESQSSQEIVAIPNAPKVVIPAAPSKILASIINNQVVISWEEVPKATQYNVYMASQPGVTPDTVSALDNGAVFANVSTPYTTKEFPEDAKYYFSVTAANDAGESAAKVEVSIQPPKQQIKLQTPRVTVRRNTAHYLVLTNNGKAFSEQSIGYAQQPWTCAQSKSTGLYWEVKTNDGGLHDKDNTYTWHSDNPQINNGVKGTANGGTCAGSECDTAAFVTAVNQSNYCGFNDWRLPTRDELKSLIDASAQYPAPTIDMDSFPNTSDSFYWSATSFAHNPDLAWFVYFGSGYDYYEYKSFASHVRLVRGNASN